MHTNADNHEKQREKVPRFSFDNSTLDYIRHAIPPIPRLPGRRCGSEKLALGRRCGVGEAGGTALCLTASSPMASPIFFLPLSQEVRDPVAL
jgi:hypothetical protein